MKKIIKINTIKPKIKVGDIVQFNDLAPVKAVKFTDCCNCAMDKLPEEVICSSAIPYCDYFEDENYIVSNGIMFKAIKTKVKQ